MLLVKFIKVTKSQEILDDCKPENWHSVLLSKNYAEAFGDLHWVPDFIFYKVDSWTEICKYEILSPIGLEKRALTQTTTGGVNSSQ